MRACRRDFSFLSQVTTWENTELMAPMRRPTDQSCFLFFFPQWNNISFFASIYSRVIHNVALFTLNSKRTFFWVCVFVVCCCMLLWWFMTSLLVTWARWRLWKDKERDFLPATWNLKQTTQTWEWRFHCCTNEEKFWVWHLHQTTQLWGCGVMCAAPTQVYAGLM